MNYEFLKKEVFPLNNGILSYFFQIQNGGGKEYTVNLKYLDSKMISCHCTCIFASYYGWSKRNLKRNNPPICRHIKMAMREIENGITKKDIKSDTSI
jgi:hypothetical protein